MSQSSSDSNDQSSKWLLRNVNFLNDRTKTNEIEARQKIWNRSIRYACTNVDRRHSLAEQRIDFERASFTRWREVACDHVAAIRELDRSICRRTSHLHPAFKMH